MMEYDTTLKLAGQQSIIQSHARFRHTFFFPENFKAFKLNKIILSQIILICICFLSGCSNEKIIDEDKFVKVYADMVISQDTMSTPANGAVAGYTNTKKLRDEILKRHNVTDEQYKQTINYYNKNPQDWERFFNKVVTYIDGLKKRI